MEENPKVFYWGAATSAHQVEGGTKNDWSEWEKQNAERLARDASGNWEKWQQEKFPEMFESSNYISGKACDHFHRYEEDFYLAREGGHNAHRFSIEWSRIEPEEGKFDGDAMAHYARVVKSLKARDLEPFVTLWHWTMPVWLAEKGGVHSSVFVKYFVRYSEYVTQHLKDDVRFWVTLNEPTSVIGMAYGRGDWPPQKLNPFLALKAYFVLARTHREAFRKIHAVAPNAQVGFSNIFMWLKPENKNNLLHRFSTHVAEFFANNLFLLLTKKCNDYLTVQFYHYRRVKMFSLAPMGKQYKVSDLNWDISPEGIYHLLKKTAKYGLPLYITENGIADTDDNKRTEFIQEHIKWMQKAIDEGVDVRGYFYWSLLDNFEWDKGFWPRFGLIEVDYTTLERKPRKSFWEYKKIIENRKADSH